MQRTVLVQRVQTSTEILLPTLVQRVQTSTEILLPTQVQGQSSQRNLRSGHSVWRRVCVAGLLCAAEAIACPAQTITTFNVSGCGHGIRPMDHRQLHQDRR
jgi:hypothetical protein